MKSIGEYEDMNLVEDYFQKVIMVWKQQMYKDVGLVICSICENSVHPWNLQRHTFICKEKREVYADARDCETEILKISNELQRNIIQ